MNESKKALNEELNAIKKMMGLDNTSAKYQFSQDLQDDPDYAQFKKDAMYKDENGQQWSYGTPNATSMDHYIDKAKYSRVGSEDLGEEMESGMSVNLNKRDRDQFDAKEAWNDRCDILHMVKQHCAALRSHVSSTLKFLDRADGPITKDTVFSKALNLTFYDAILSMETTVNELAGNVARYEELSQKLGPNKNS